MVFRELPTPKPTWKITRCRPGTHAYGVSNVKQRSERMQRRTTSPAAVLMAEVKYSTAELLQLLSPRMGGDASRIVGLHAYIGAGLVGFAHQRFSK